MNTLKDKFLPNDGTEKTFIKLLDKFEYIIGKYTSQKRNRTSWNSIDKFYQ